MDDVTAQFGALVFDAARDPDTYDRRMWSVDRMHPSERGSRLIAGRFHDRLAVVGYRSAPARSGADQPATDPRRPGGVDGHQGHRWVIRRSTDLVPYLMFMGPREMWGSRRWTRHHARPTTAARARRPARGPARRLRGWFLTAGPANSLTGQSRPGQPRLASLDWPAARNTG